MLSSTIENPDEWQVMDKIRSHVLYLRRTSKLTLLMWLTLHLLAVIKENMFCSLCNYIFFCLDFYFFCLPWTPFFQIMNLRANKNVFLPSYTFSQTHKNTHTLLVIIKNIHTYVVFYIVQTCSMNPRSTLHWSLGAYRPQFGNHWFCSIALDLNHRLYIMDKFKSAITSSIYHSVNWRITGIGGRLWWCLKI